jgi:hypothetical protein
LVLLLGSTRRVGHTHTAAFSAHLLLDLKVSLFPLFPFSFHLSPSFPAIRFLSCSINGSITNTTDNSATHSAFEQQSPWQQYIPFKFPSSQTTLLFNTIDTPFSKAFRSKKERYRLVWWPVVNPGNVCQKNATPHCKSAA